jgi:hypothetical protein
MRIWGQVGHFGGAPIEMAAPDAPGTTRNDSRRSPLGSKKPGAADRNPAD